ncbi:hypothetical protein JQS43_17655 [Natronosporangium hydrolyticum]|uniref:Uncharacterized protein n=1 Tax=Natronosporangium hydrolyticum TaxID=2811111 RepID=A0A895YFV7_9ACTN|nr:hypothetical protein [Natronosporangium hydrolyticum]QSB13426.1 hypothetical protein JQS43_17655 [Natronosporangium hydrolyticum]
MLGIPPTVAPETVLAQETPFQNWLSNWLAWLSDNLPMIFIVVAVLTGILVLAKGGVKQVLIFAIGAALAFLLLTNLEAIADFFSDELPIDAPPGPPEAPESPAPTEDATG